MTVTAIKATKMSSDVYGYNGMSSSSAKYGSIKPEPDAYRVVEKSSGESEDYTSRLQQFQQVPVVLPAFCGHQDCLNCNKKRMPERTSGRRAFYQKERTSGRRASSQKHSL